MGWFRADLFGSRIAFTDRGGGVSLPPFHSLNLSDAAGDDAAAVAENRRRAADRFGTGADASSWVPMRQVHGAATVVARDSMPPGPAEADAVVVTAPGPTGVVLTADCAPVALVGPGGVAGVHGGWRGLHSGVVESAVDAFRSVAGDPALAVLGACIRPCCYEFGATDLQTMVERFGPSVAATTTSGRPALDVPAVVRVALREQGVSRLVDLAACTVCRPGWFSYRRDGVTGRQALLVARRGDPVEARGE